MVPSAALAKSRSCWSIASTTYRVNVRLLYAIARVESGLHAGAVSRNGNGSYDIGLMQINSWWLPKLAKYGITARKLRTNACLNLKVGAWILAQSVRRYGMNWRGVGAYNARTDHKRAAYARKVVRELKAIAAEQHRAEASSKAGTAAPTGSAQVAP